MCILCVIQKWSRRAATMLPWLVIPLIGLWALSQLLPPAFRFEITSPRLACVFVLLVTLFWYEILVPQVSSWRVRRNARIRERKRLEAIEMQKLKKTATKRCRNCLTPYRDQNPGGGRFMCAYCGHNSKRPVLDLFVPPGVGVLNAGDMKDLAGKGGKVCPENSLICSQDWLENGNWVGGSFTGKLAVWKKSGGAFFGGDDHCMAEQSYFGVFTFACKLMTSFFLSIRWLLRKIFRISLSKDDDSPNAKNKGMLAKRGENVVELHESRSEKARRKAEEKRQARLEKELLEEEERKQREEVTRLVEERRRFRDEKMEAEKDRGRGSNTVREKDSRKEAEQKRHERRKDKDKGSSKSNSDVEESEKKAGKENDRKQDFDNKNNSYKKENLIGSKSLTSNNYTRANAGTRYLDRMKGSFLSSSKAFAGGRFFGRGSNTPATLLKESRPNEFVEHAQSCANKKELSQPSVGGKVNMDADDKHSRHPVSSDPQPRVTPKKKWQQLFTGSSTVTPSSYSNVTSTPNQKSHSEVEISHLSGQSLPTQMFDNPIGFGLPSPFTRSKFSEGSTISSLNFPSLNESMIPCVGESLRESPLQEEPELFEDPRYVPDPVYLFGPISESLDSFQLDIGLDKPRSLISEVNRPSPIESPLSRLKMTDDKYSSGSNRFSSTINSKAQDKQTSPLGDSKSSSETGTWHMWNSSSLVQDGLGLVNGMASWLSPQEKSRSHMEDFLNPSSYKNTASLFTKEELDFTSTHSPQHVFLSSCQASGGMFAPPFGGVTDQDPWSEEAVSPRLSCNEHHFPLNPREEASKKMMFGNFNKCESNHPMFDLPLANSLSKKENGSGEGVRTPSVMKPHIVGGLYCNPDVHSLWSYD